MCRGAEEGPQGVLMSGSVERRGCFWEISGRRDWREETNLAFILSDLLSALKMVAISSSEIITCVNFAPYCEHSEALLVLQRCGNDRIQLAYRYQRVGTHTAFT